jgi:D-glycero-D-manno-heptose 1,7-bisphosphate phosphatase
MSGADLRPAVFLDRDGCVNVEDHYITDIARFRLYPETLPSMKRLNDAGFLLVIVTNQGGIAKELMTAELVEETHRLFLSWTAAAGVTVDAIHYCPHHPEGTIPDLSQPCDCRKPATGMVTRAAADLGVDLSRSYMVGDKLSDTEMGKNAGMTTILVRTGFGERQRHKIDELGVRPPDAVCDHIGAATDWILAHAGKEK